MRRVPRPIHQDVNAKVIELAPHYTQQEIADRTGLSQTRVGQILRKERVESLPADLRETAWREIYAELRATRRVYYEMAMAGDNVSARTYVKIVDSQKRLLGLDAPTTIRAAFGMPDEPQLRYILEFPEGVAEALS